MTLIGPSLMCADMGILKETVIRLDQAGVDFFHLDIMDGNFVPNFTMGPDLIKSIRPYTNKPFDVHLMVKNPENHLDTFIESGANMISVHVEATDHLQKTLKTIRDKGLKAGVALNPSTPIQELVYVLDTIDYVTVMTVNPGFAGQKFIPLMYQKISDLKYLLNKAEYEIDIQVDGNIGYETIPDVLKNGANMLVCGTSSLFKPDVTFKEAVNQLKDFTENQKTDQFKLNLK
jgi:ribulose-phosphate 3-epimerase